MSRRELPTVGAPIERADAARNRRRILEVADGLFARKGADNVSMDEVAEAAGVGKGTLYRRFRDKAGLAIAVLDEKERRLQEKILRGPPPLGPDGDPKERIRALVGEMLTLIDQHTETYIVSESGGNRYRSGWYDVLRRTVVICLADLKPDVDPAIWADAVLAPLNAELFNFLRHERGFSLTRIKREVIAFVDAAIG